MKLVAFIVLAINFLGWFAIYEVGTSIFTGRLLSPAMLVYKTEDNPKETPAKRTIQTARVSTDALNMREGPSADNTLITRLHRGDSVRVIEKVKDSAWVKVEYKEQSGYVHRDYITIEGDE